jgi:hypothetical protein
LRQRSLVAQLCGEASHFFGPAEFGPAEVLQDERGSLR